MREMEVFEKSLFRVARNLTIVADRLKDATERRVLYMVAAEIRAEAMRPDKDKTE